MRETKTVGRGSLILGAIAGSMILAACTQTPNAAQMRDAEKRRAIAALQTKARSFIDSGRYEEAQPVLDQILEVDPTNEFAIGEYPIVTDAHNGFKKQVIIRAFPDSQDDPPPL